MRMRTITLQLRFLVPLIAVLTAAAYFTLPLMDRLTLRWFARDLNMRGALVATTMSDSVADAVQDPRGRKLRALFGRVMQDERLVAIGWCSQSGEVLVRTPSFPADLSCASAEKTSTEADPQLRVEGGPVHVSVHEVESEVGPVGRLILLHDLSFIERRSQDTRRYLVLLIAGMGGLMALVTMVVAQLSWSGWVRGTRALLRGEGLLRPMSGSGRGGAGAHRRRNCALACVTWRTSTGARVTRSPTGTRPGCSRCCAPSCAATR